MTANEEEPIGFVRKLTEEEIAWVKRHHHLSDVIRPDENGNYKVPFRFKIDPKDWRGFNGSTIEKEP